MACINLPRMWWSCCIRKHVPDGKQETRIRTSSGPGAGGAKELPGSLPALQAAMRFKQPCDADATKPHLFDFLCFPDQSFSGTDRPTVSRADCKNLALPLILGVADPHQRGRRRATDGNALARVDLPARVVDEFAGFGTPRDSGHPAWRDSGWRDSGHPAERFGTPRRDSGRDSGHPENGRDVIRDTQKIDGSERRDVIRDTQKIDGSERHPRARVGRDSGHPENRWI